MEKIEQALLTHFERHRIVFWYDDKKEFRTDFDALHLPDIEKIELTNNEFTVKYRLLRQQPDQKFLLYLHGPSPHDLDNWLLDIQLAHTEFRTDQVSLWLSELELGHEFITPTPDSPVSLFSSRILRRNRPLFFTSSDGDAESAGEKFSQLIQNIWEKKIKERISNIKFELRNSLASTSKDEDSAYQEIKYLIENPDKRSDLV